MDVLWTKIANEAGLVAALLILACAGLWRELVKARAEYIAVLKGSITEKTEALKNYLEFKAILQGTTEALKENNTRLEKVEEVLEDYRRRPGRR